MNVSLRTACFCALALLLMPLGANSQNQYKISGEVIDSATRKGVEFATITLTDAAAKPVAAWVCDANGKYEYTVKSAGTYRATVASVGYTTLNREVTIDQSTARLDPFILSPGVEIESVAVTTTKPLIRSDIDKIAYSVEADPEAPASTALDILRKVPLISVDAEDNVLLQGQSNYKVLVNGKSSSLMERNFKEVIRSMPASSIKDIEVITNPSSKYEAEGVGGIINIITARKTLSGYNGSLGLNADSRGGYGGNGYINAKFGKFSISGNLYAGAYRSPGGHSTSRQENFLSDENRFIDTDAESDKVKQSNISYQIEASYEIDTFNLITLSMWGYNGKYNYGTTSRSLTMDIDSLPVREFKNISTGEGRYGGLSGNIDYQRTFRKPDKTFTVSYKLENNPDDTDYSSDVVGILNYASYRQRSEDNTLSRQQTIQVDYVDPLSKKHSIEAGTKFILRQNSSDPQTYDWNGSEWVLDPARKNALDYDQYILGVYGAYTFKLKKFSAKVGGRLENTWNDGLFSNAVKDTPFDNQQFNVIPYATLSYAPKASNRYSLSYTQRLSRPGIWYLNPYVNDVDPMNISFGNPALDAEVSHSFSATYGIYNPKTTLSLTGNMSTTDNSIERLTTVGDDGVSVTTYYNIGHRDTYRLNAYYSYRPNAKFSVNLNAAGGYVNVGNGAELDNDGFTYNGNLSLRFGLWKGGAINAMAFYNSPNIMLQGKGSGYFIHSLGINQKAFKDKVTFNFAVSSPFKKEMRFTTEYDTETFSRRTDSYNPIRQARLGITYNFGKTQVQVKRARRGITNDDLKSGEGSGGGGGASTSPQ